MADFDVSMDPGWLDRMNEHYGDEVDVQVLSPDFRRVISQSQAERTAANRQLIAAPAPAQGAKRRKAVLPGG